MFVCVYEKVMVRYCINVSAQSVTRQSSSTEEEEEEEGYI